METDIAILGSGPAGYSAAFRASDLGKKVVLIERYNDLGGVCINVGCIPAKALLYITKLLGDSKDFTKCGVDFRRPKINLKELESWKLSIVSRLGKVLAILAKQRSIEVVKGYGKFLSSSQIEVKSESEDVLIEFKNAIIAAGSSPIKIPFLPEDKRIITSTDALILTDIPNKFLIIGGGAIGLEVASIYDALGSKVTIVESKDQLVDVVDKDIVEPMYQRILKKYEQILLNTKVTKVEAKFFGLEVTLEHKDGKSEVRRFDKILVAVGRQPNGNLIGAENAGINVDEKGFIIVDEKLRTNVPNIFAAGDIISHPLLAHKAIFEGRFAAEIIAGKETSIKSKNIPNVIYTDPGIATVGLSEKETIQNNMKYTKKVFPWAANGRSLTINRQEGITKLLFDSETHKIIGGSIVGTNAGELIAEIAMAIENGLTAENVASTIHPHPALSETIMLAAEDFLGTIGDYY